MGGVSWLGFSYPGYLAPLVQPGLVCVRRAVLAGEYRRSWPHYAARAAGPQARERLLAALRVEPGVAEFCYELPRPPWSAYRGAPRGQPHEAWGSRGVLRVAAPSEPSWFLSWSVPQPPAPLLEQPPWLISYMAHPLRRQGYVAEVAAPSASAARERLEALLGQPLERSSCWALPPANWSTPKAAAWLLRWRLAVPPAQPRPVAAARFRAMGEVGSYEAVVPARGRAAAWELVEQALGPVLRVSSSECTDMIAPRGWQPARATGEQEARDE